MSLEIRHLYKAFAGVPTLVDVSLDVQPGELICLLGPSGCGKTTLLRIVAGLLSPDDGDLRLDGQPLLDTPARERGFGIVFQSYSLFPHMTAAENIGYGLRLRQTPKTAIQSRVHALLDMVGLPTLADRYPDQLSGGQQQRVALARALAIEPRVLLLDEPLSALDAQVRAQLRSEIRDIQQRLKIPTLMVTHDQEEAMSMADRIVCMQSGRIMQVGTSRALYQAPANRFVAEFMGQSNILEASQAMRCWPALRRHLDSRYRPGHALCIRPEQLRLSPHALAALADDGHEPNAVRTTAEVTQSQFIGNVQRVQLRCEDLLLWSECSAQADWRTGQAVSVQLAVDGLTWVAA